MLHQRFAYLLVFGVVTVDRADADLFTFRFAVLFRSFLFLGRRPFRGRLDLPTKIFVSALATIAMLCSLADSSPATMTMHFCSCCGIGTCLLY
jgi:hypothetical protein